MLSVCGIKIPQAEIFEKERFKISRPVKIYGDVC